MFGLILDVVIAIAAVVSFFMIMNSYSKYLTKKVNFYLTKAKETNDPKYMKLAERLQKFI